MIHNSRFRAGISAGSAERSKQAGSYYWTMDCFQNIRRGVIIADFKRGISGGSSDRSKKAGGYYWTMNCFQNVEGVKVVVR